MFRKNSDMMLFGLKANQSSLAGVWIFLAVYLGSTIFASILTPPVFWLVEAFSRNFPENNFASWLIRYETDVYFDRLRWIGIIIGLPWAMKKCGLFSLRNLGISASPKRISIFGKCFVSGVALALVIFSLQIIFTNVKYNSGISLSYILSAVGAALISGLILGFIEELVFRGLIMRCFYTAWGALPAIILSSLFFAYKHFKVPSSIWDSISYGRYEAHWDTGFLIAYYDTIGISIDFNLMVFASLTMFGAVLCALYLRSKTLLAPFGMHAGIVTSILTYRRLFDIGDDPKREIFGNAGMTNGYVALITLTIIFFIISFTKCRKDK